MVLPIIRITKRKLLLIFKDIFMSVVKDSEIHLQNYKILVKKTPDK